MKLLCIALAVAVVTAQPGAPGFFGGPFGFGPLGPENAILGPHSPIAPFTRDVWGDDTLTTTRVTNAPFGQVSTPVEIPLEKVDRFIPAPWKPDGVAKQTFAYPNPEGAVVKEEASTARVSEVVAGPGGAPIVRPAEVKVAVVETVPVPGPTGTETASVYEPIPNEPKEILEPKKVKLNPNLLSRFTEELYNHGDMLIERVRSIENAGNPVRSPLIRLPPIQVPSGYTLSNMDGLIAKLFFFAGRCSSAWTQQNHEHQVMMDGLFPGGPVFVAPDVFTWNACYDGQARYWLDEEWDDYVEDEVKKMYKFMVKYPETISTVGYAPSAVSFPFPTLSPRRIHAMRAFPRAFYRLWPTVAREVTRVLADVGGPLPDFDEILNNVLSPANIGAFGFAPGFKIEGVSDFVLSLILKTMQCRSQMRHARKFSVFSNGPPDGPLPIGWGPLPGAPVDPILGPVNKCVQDIIIDWYGDDWEDLAMDIAGAFGEETATEVRPAEPAHSRPVPINIIPDTFGDHSTAGEPVIVAGYGGRENSFTALDAGFGGLGGGPPFGGPGFGGPGFGGPGFGGPGFGGPGWGP